MKIHRNEVIQGKNLTLDGTQFLDCNLISCKLKYNGGIVILKGTAVTNCTWDLTGPALNTVELLTTLGALRSSVTETWSISPGAGRHGQ